MKKHCLPFGFDAIFDDSAILNSKNLQGEAHYACLQFILLTKDSADFEFGNGTKKDCVYMRPVQFHTGMKVVRVGLADGVSSYRSDFVFRPVSCKRTYRKTIQPVRIHTGLSSYRSHVNTPLDDTLYKFHHNLRRKYSLSKRF